MYVHDPNALLVRPPHLAPAPRRSAIPKVIGTLAIVFAGLGALGILVALGMAVAAEEELAKYGLEPGSLGAFGAWLYVYVALAAVLFAIHLTAGIQCVRYAASAPRWMTIYGIAAVALAIADVAVPLATFPGGDGYMHEALRAELVMPRFGLAVLGLPWPIIALVMMNLRAARLACAPGRT